MNVRVISSARNRAHWREEFGLADSLSTQIERFARSLAVPRGDARRLVIATLLLRTGYSLEAISLLAGRGYATEARGQLRSLMEATVKLAGLHAKPQLLREYMIQDELMRKRMFNDILAMRNGWPEGTPKDPSDEAVGAMLAECVQTIRDYERDHNGGRRISDSKFIEWAEHGGILQLVLGHYRLASNALHHGSRDLERRFHVVDGDLDGLIIGPESDDLGDILLYASKLAFVAVERAAWAFEKAIPSRVEELYAEHSRISEAKAETALAQAKT